MLSQKNGVSTNLEHRAHHVAIQHPLSSFLSISAKMNNATSNVFQPTFVKRGRNPSSNLGRLTEDTVPYRIGLDFKFNIKISV